MKIRFLLCLLAFSSLLPARAWNAGELAAQYQILLLKDSVIYLPHDASDSKMALEIQRYTTLAWQDDKLVQRNTLAKVVECENFKHSEVIKAYLSTGEEYEFIISGTPFPGSNTQPAIIPQYEPVDLGTEDEYLFEFGGRSYAIRTTCDQEDGIYIPTDFRITLTDQTAGVTQLISEIPQLFYTVPQIWWISDIDGDGEPDLILQEGTNMYQRNWVLYLSAYAREGELVRAVAAYETREVPE